MESSNIKLGTPTKSTYSYPDIALDISKDNRAFVSRGNEIFVHKGEEKVKAAYVAKEKDGTIFSPRKISLYDQSNKMLLLSPLKKNIVVYNDTEKGKSLHQMALKLTDDVGSPNRTVAGETKYGRLSAQETVKLKVVSGNQIVDLNWDVRTPTKQIFIQDQTSSIVKTKNLQFTDVATTSNGGIAVASNDGVVRLYSELGKKAKTQIDQYSGTPITAIDTSSDGNWLVCTTDKNLILINVSFETDKGEKTTGFDKAMGKNKSAGLLCRLSEKDLAQIDITEDELQFTPARFDNGPSIDTSGVIIERYVITSTGQYTIQWNMRALEADYKNLQHGSSDGLTYQPQARAKIFKQPDTVFAQTFDYESNYNVVSALAEDVKRFHMA